MTVTPLDKLLRSLDARLGAEDVPNVQDAEIEIWNYLSAFDGLTAQVPALDDLTAAFAERPTDSPLYAMICHHIAQHKHCLSDL